MTASNKPKESPTKKFKRATAKFVRDELSKTQHSHTLRYAALEVGIGIVIGFGIAFSYVTWAIP